MPVRECLRRDEHLQTLGSLASSFSHEIRNPLTSIKMLVQAAIEEPMRAALTDQDMRMIEQEVRRIEATLQTFLDFARPVRTERDRVDLQEVLVAVSGLLRRRAEKQNGKWRILPMHRAIIGAVKGEKVDHRDGNGLNNRRRNLRIATSSQNAANARVKPGRLKGVYLQRLKVNAIRPFNARLCRLRSR